MKLLIFTTAVLLCAGCAQAELVGLYNTGVDDSGTPLANGALDSHYSLLSTPTSLASSTPVVLTSAGGFPIGPWLADDSASAWISLAATPGAGPVGNYDYRLTFDVSAIDLLDSVALSGQWAADNGGVDILVNGVSSGSTAAGFSSWSSFNLASGFAVGSNTLDFIVNNADCGGCSNPTGLRVEVASSETPEPASIALFSLGLATAFLVTKFKKETFTNE